MRKLTPADFEREREEARRKAQLDYNTDMYAARMEGLIEGFAEVMQKTAIHFYERLLGRRETPNERLEGMSLADLTHLANELRRQALKELAGVRNPD